MKKETFSLFLSLIAMLPGLGFAADYRVATVDLNRILNESKEAQEERKKIEGITTKKRKEIDTKKESLRELEKKLLEAKVEKESKEAENLRTQARDLARFVKDSEEEIKREYMKVTKSLMDEALEVIQAYADRQQISIVLEKSNGMRGPILYGTKGMDITDDIITQLNS